MKRLLPPLLSGLLVLAPAWAQPAKSGGPSDAQIVAIVAALNRMDVDVGKLAKSRTRNKDVSALAQQLVTDHAAVNQQTKKLKIKPAQSDTSQALKTTAADTMTKLKGLKGAEFDRAYVDHEVQNHQAIIDTLDRTLIPSAANLDLSDLLSKLRPAIVTHLEHAKQVQSKLKG